jgi:ribosomal protein S19E (S16A)
MKKNVIGYVPISIGPTKLELALAQAPELNDESNTKVCIIQDIVKIAKTLGVKPPAPEQFDWLYDQSISMLEAIQHSGQVELNTLLYKQRVLSKL